MKLIQMRCLLSIQITFNPYLIGSCVLQFLKGNAFRQSPASSNPELSSTNNTGDELCSQQPSTEKSTAPSQVVPAAAQDGTLPAQNPSSSAATALVAPCSSLGASASAPLLGAAAAGSSAPVVESPKLRTRCEKCNKKVGFTGESAIELN